MTVVNENQDKTVKNFEDLLKSRFISPMALFYGEAMKRGGTIFERLGLVEDAEKGVSDDGNTFGAVSYMGGLAQGREFDSPRQVHEFERRMKELEQQNLALVAELATLATLKEHKASSTLEPNLRVKYLTLVWMPCWSALGCWRDKMANQFGLGPTGLPTWSIARLFYWRRYQGRSSRHSVTTWSLSCTGCPRMGSRCHRKRS
jgi:hypothetical protein